MDQAKCIAKLDEIVKTSLQALIDDGTLPLWYGREKEVVSLYAFGHLAPLCKQGSILYDPTQIGIDVGVPQLPSKPVQIGIDVGVPQLPTTKTKRRHLYVCKDLIIWQDPKMITWDTNGDAIKYPLCIMEWKSINRNDPPNSKVKRDGHQGDIDWLCAISMQALKRPNPPTPLLPLIGYAVLINAQAKPPVIECTRVYEGEREDNWFTATARPIPTDGAAG